VFIHTFDYNFTGKTVNQFTCIVTMQSLGIFDNFLSLLNVVPVYSTVELYIFSAQILLLTYCLRGNSSSELSQS